MRPNNAPDRHCDLMPTRHHARIGQAASPGMPAPLAGKARRVPPKSFELFRRPATNSRCNHCGTRSCRSPLRASMPKPSMPMILPKRPRPVGGPLMAPFASRRASHPTQSFAAICAGVSSSAATYLSLAKYLHQASPDRECCRTCTNIFCNIGAYHSPSTKPAAAAAAAGAARPLFESFGRLAGALHSNACMRRTGRTECSRACYRAAVTHGLLRAHC